MLVTHSPPVTRSQSQLGLQKLVKLGRVTEQSKSIITTICEGKPRPQDLSDDHAHSLLKLRVN